MNILTKTTVNIVTYTPSKTTVNIATYTPSKTKQKVTELLTKVEEILGSLDKPEPIVIRSGKCDFHFLEWEEPGEKHEWTFK